MPGAALIDRDTVAGAVRFHFEARKHDIKPIIGSEITMENGSLLPLLPMNLKGYQNLSKLITTIKLRNKKGEHFATRKDIEDHSSGLLCFTGGADGFIHNSIKNGCGQIDLAWLNYVFEKRLYVELQRHHLRNEEAINQSLLGLAHKLRLAFFCFERRLLRRPTRPRALRRFHLYKKPHDDLRRRQAAFEKQRALSQAA